MTGATRRELEEKLAPSSNSVGGEAVPIHNSSAFGPVEVQSMYNVPAFMPPATPGVAIYVEGDYANAQSDNDTFRAEFGLPATTITKLTIGGATSPLPAIPPLGNDNYQNNESSIDVASVSAICPTCSILLLEDVVGRTADGYETAAQTAYRLGFRVMTTSFYQGEYPNEDSDQYEGGTTKQGFNLPGMAIFAASGDNWLNSATGLSYPTNDSSGSMWPGYSTFVMAVGGTVPVRNSSRASGWSETNWGPATDDPSTADGNSGWGCSQYVPMPPWQQNFPATGGALGIDLSESPCQISEEANVLAKANSDISALSGEIFEYNGAKGGWLHAAGTSVSSPIAAGIFALTGAVQATTFPSGYSPASYPYLNAEHFNYVQATGDGIEGYCGGGNPLCNGGFAWDGPTGLGTPNASAILSSSASSLSLDRFETANGSYITSGSSWIQSNYVAGGVSLAGSFNGVSAPHDGIAYVWDEGGFATIDMHASSGSALLLQRWATQIVPWRPYAQWLTGDFNGDGFTDLIQVSPVDGLNSDMQVDVLINKGNDDATTPAFEVIPALIGNPGWVLGLTGTFVTGRFQGNASTDLAYIFEGPGGTVSIDVYNEVYLPYENTSGYEAVFSQSHALVAEGAWHSPAGDVTGAPGSWAMTPPSQWLVGDFNGNGVDSIVNAWSTSGGSVGLSGYTMNSSFPPSAEGTFAYAAIPTGGFGGASGTGAWEQQGWWTVGDFDGDGRSDLAYAFNSEGEISIDGYLARSAPGVPFNKVRLQTHVGDWEGTGTFPAGHFARSLTPANTLVGSPADIAMVFDSGGLTTDVHVNLASALQLCGPSYTELGGTPGAAPMNGACL